MEEHPINGFILNQSGNQREILLCLHDWLYNDLNLEAKIRYGIPFYFKTTWICYLNLLKGDKIDFAFLAGRELDDSHGLFQMKNRKMVRSIELSSAEQIPFELLEQLLQEAVQIQSK